MEIERDIKTEETMTGTRRLGEESIRERENKKVRNDEFRFRRSRALGQVLRIPYTGTGSKIVRTGHSYLL